MYPHKREGSRQSTFGYRFFRLGDVPVTIKQPEEYFELENLLDVPVTIEQPEDYFELENLPSRPFAVSEQRGLVFVAHLKGFFVAWTKDVIRSAIASKEGGQGSSIQELSIVDVPLGQVPILALSANSSMLAASVGSKIHFFSVDCLVNEDRQESFSKSINGSSCIKDMHWNPHIEDQYVVLTNAGKLYRGAGQNDLSSLLDDGHFVDAVNWSWNGKYLAVAKHDTLKGARLEVLEEFEEVKIQKRFDSLVNGDAKVDSITWVRRNWIILGLSDGKMKNHVVHLIWSRLNNITNVANDIDAVTFDSPFLAIEDDIPSGSAPYTLVSYLDEFELAFVANKRNTCDHIGLFKDANYGTMLDIVGDDSWMPTIDLPANGDNFNMILGLAIDKVNQNNDDILMFREDERFGLDESIVSPCCIVMCLTVDGKLFLFNFARRAG